MSGTLLGLDIGSSSIKASLLDIDSGRVIGHSCSPSDELPISAPQPGWAEQHPDLWWEHVCKAVYNLRFKHHHDLSGLRAIGLAYQMHGLVLVDESGAPVRPAILWCDSRAVRIGAAAYESLGPDHCVRHFGNSPGNFTAAKLAWVQEHEPEALQRAVYFMLPGDYIVLRLTGRFGTTPSGLSEGTLWDYTHDGPALDLLDHLSVRTNIVPPITPNIGVFGQIRAEVAHELGLPEGIPVSYRAGDQPNHALSLNVLEPGEVAANAGTSGVILGVATTAAIDKRARVNNFLHVNHDVRAPRIGSLVCINGAGCFYRWLRHVVTGDQSYDEMDQLAATAPIGSGGLVALPYGNGTERTLGNRLIGASLESIDLNRHGRAEIVRAAQEGVVFALRYGLEIMESMGLSPSTIRAGSATMFKSEVVRNTFATLTNVPLSIFETDGAEGAARGAGIGAGIFSFANAFNGLCEGLTTLPRSEHFDETVSAYQRWKETLHHHESVSESTSR